MHDRSITWLNETGDVTLEWSKDRDEVMKKIIQQKMDEGYSFFIVKRRVDTSYQKVSSVAQIKNCKITITDKEAEQLMSGNGVGLSALPPGDMTTEGRATTATQVSRSKSVAVKPMRGG